MPLPLRLPLPSYNDMPIQYVAPWGDDANDGYDFRYPKQTLLAAYDFAFARHPACEFQVAHNTYIGGTNQWSPVGAVNVPGQGFWLDGTRLVDPLAPLYPGWRVAMPHRIIGMPGHTLQGQFGFSHARLIRGKPGDVTKPGPRFDCGYWLMRNQNATAYLREVSFFDFSIGIRIGVDGNPAGDPDAGSSRGTNESCQMVYFDKVEVDANPRGHDANEGPQVDCGYYLWVYFYQCAFNSSQDNAPTSDRRAAILVKTGDGSAILNLDQCRGDNGGIIYYAGPATWGVWIRNYLVESNGEVGFPSVVALKDLNASGYGVLDNIQAADYGAGAEPQISIESGGAFLNSSQVYVIGSPGVSARGPCTVIGAGSDQAFAITDFHTAMKAGFVQGKIWGDSDAGRSPGPAIAARWRNMIPQHSDDGGITGPVLVQPQNESSNAVYTATGATGAHGVDSPVKDKFGGTNAFRLASNNGTQANCDPFAARAYGCSVGERFAVGAWIRGTSGMPLFIPMSLGLTGTPNPAVQWINSNGGGSVPTMIGDGEWQWHSMGQVITNLNGGDGTVTVSLHMSGSQATPIEVCGLTLLRIPSGETTNNEFGLLLQNMANMPQINPGYVGTQLNQVLCATGGLAIGKTTAIGSHVIGAVNGYATVKDPDGNTLGVIEIKTLTS